MSAGPLGGSITTAPLRPPAVSTRGVFNLRKGVKTACCQGPLSPSEEVKGFSEAPDEMEIKMSSVQLAAARSCSRQRNTHPQLMFPVINSVKLLPFSLRPLPVSGDGVDAIGMWIISLAGSPCCWMRYCNLLLTQLSSNNTLSERCEGGIIAGSAISIRHLKHWSSCGLETIA